jgi:hypothetical protein
MGRGADVKRRHIESGIAIFLLAALILGSLTAMVVGQNNCSDRGGDYVRSTFWFTCVDEDE